MTIAIQGVTANPTMPATLVAFDYVQDVAMSVTAFQQLERVASLEGLHVTVPTVRCRTFFHITLGVGVVPVTFVALQS